MLLHIYLLSFISSQYLADATSVSESYQKIQTSIAKLPRTVTFMSVRSRIECTMKCLSRRCVCFSYDASLRECGIDYCLLQGTNISNTREFFVTCNTNEGFRLFTNGSVTVCLWVSNTSANYSIAKNDCKARSAQLYTVKTIEKLNILRANFPMWYWVGLNDIEVEDTFRWEDDNTICDLTCRTQLFLPNQPDNDYNEDCAFYVMSGLQDGKCYDPEIYYICEKLF